jgi:hypothetical protein
MPCIRGYRDALKLIHEQGAQLPLTADVILQLHRLSRGNIWDAAQFKEEDGEIIERYPDGRSRVRFKPVSAALTPEWINTLLENWHRCLRDRQVPGLIALAAFILSGTVMAGFLVCPYCCKPISLAMKWDATSAWNG